MNADNLQKYPSGSNKKLIIWDSVWKMEKVGMAVRRGRNKTMC